MTPRQQRSRSICLCNRPSVRRPSKNQRSREVAAATAWLVGPRAGVIKTAVCTGQPRYNRVGGCETMQDYEFTVVIERDEDGRFVAICPALQGCYTEGETEEEARQLIEDAIRLHVESRIARNEPIYEEVGSHKVRVA